jgi:formate/nitrite transporter FocA (FNT family)
MKRLLKVVLPPLLGFFILFTAVRYSGYYFTLKPDEMGGGDIISFMSYYRYTLPLLFIDGLLTQWLIAVPVWNSIINRSAAYKVTTLIGLVFICTLFSFGISYIIWDELDGVQRLMKLTGLMTTIQLVYWLINILVLVLLSRSKSDLET